MSREAEAPIETVMRLAKTLEDVQAQVQQMGADFQLRLEQAEKNRIEDIKRKEDEVRKAITRELLDRFEVEVQKLGNEFDNRRRHVIAETEAAAELRLQQAVETIEHEKETLKADFDTAARDWKNDREHLLHTIVKLEQDIAANQIVRQNQAAAADLEAKLSQAYQERARLQQQVADAEARYAAERDETKRAADQSRSQLLSKIDIQIKQMSAEFEDRLKKTIAATEAAAEARFGDRLNDAKEEFDRRLAEIQAEAARTGQDVAETAQREKTELNKRIEDLQAESARQRNTFETEMKQVRDSWDAERAALQAKPAPVPAGTATPAELLEKVQPEIARTESSLREIARKLDLTTTELGEEIRLNRQRSELEAYLNGLKYSLAK